MSKFAWEPSNFVVSVGSWWQDDRLN